MTDTTIQPAPTPAPAKKRSWGKLILKLFVVLVLLVVAGLVTLYLMRNNLVRMGVVRGGKYATHQETALQAADLAVTAGSLQLSKFEIENPEDFGGKFLQMDDCSVEVDSGSLLSRTVVINRISIKGLEITVQQNGLKNNLSAIMEEIKKASPAANPGPAGGSGGGGGTATQSPGKQLKISRIEMMGTKVHIRGIVTMDLDLGPIIMEDPTNPDGRPMKIADLISKVLIHVAKQIVDNPLVPGNIKDGMKNVDALVNSLRGDLMKDVSKNLKGLQDAGKQLQDATKDLQNLGKNLPDAGKGIQDAGKNLQDAGKGLQGLLGGNKPATQPK